MRKRAVAILTAGLVLLPATAVSAQPPTYVGFTATLHKITNTKVRTYSGFMRTITIVVDGKQWLRFRIKQNSTIVVPGDKLTATCRVHVRVVEDWPGPYNPTSTKNFKVC